jgi:hypothetical protein
MVSGQLTDFDLSDVLWLTTDYCLIVMMMVMMIVVIVMRMSNAHSV